MSNDGGIFGRLAARVESAEAENGFSPADLLDLDANEAAVVQAVLRSGTSRVADLAMQLGWDVDETRRVVEQLIEREAVRLDDDVVVISNWRSRRPSPGGIWARLGDL